MVSLAACIAMSSLDAPEIEAIAEHERIPIILAATFADHLLHQVDGAERIRQMIVNDIGMAAQNGQTDRVAELTEALDHFLQQHPVHADVPR
jgi:hypothetical protein